MARGQSGAASSAALIDNHRGVRVRSQAPDEDVCLRQPAGISWTHPVISHSASNSDTMLSMKVRKRHSWRWAAVAVLIALLVLGLGFVLRSVGPSTPAALPSAAKGAGRRAIQPAQNDFCRIRNLAASKALLHRAGTRGLIGIAAMTGAAMTLQRTS